MAEVLVAIGSVSSRYIREVQLPAEYLASARPRHHDPRRTACHRVELFVTGARPIVVRRQLDLENEDFLLIGVRGHRLLGCSCGGGRPAATPSHSHLVVVGLSLVLAVAWMARGCSALLGASLPVDDAAERAEVVQADRAIVRAG